MRSGWLNVVEMYLGKMALLSIFTIDSTGRFFGYGNLAGKPLARSFPVFYFILLNVLWFKVPSSHRLSLLFHR